VTELQWLGQAEGWHSDPYGRHELRFFDGHKWTPHVRDGDDNALDEPGGPVVDGAAGIRSPLLAEDVLVVERFTDLGRRWSDRSVFRPDGTRAGTLRRAPLAPSPDTASLAAPDPVRNDVVELVDDQDRLVLTLIRPVDVSRTTVEVRDTDGSDLGRIVQQTLRKDVTTYSFLAPHGHFVGELRSENWVSGDLRIEDGQGQEVATISRDLAGLDRRVLDRPDDYVVRIRQPLHEPLRTLVVACALSLEVAVRPNTPGL
jgi:hypothetical protein